MVASYAALVSMYVYSGLRLLAIILGITTIVKAISTAIKGRPTNIDWWALITFLTLFAPALTEPYLRIGMRVSFGTWDNDGFSRFVGTAHYLPGVAALSFVGLLGPIVIPTLRCYLSSKNLWYFYIYAVAALFALPIAYASNGAFLASLSIYRVGHLHYSSSISECTKELMNQFGFAIYSAAPESARVLMDKNPILNEFQYWLSSAVNSLGFGVMEAFDCKLTDIEQEKKVGIYYSAFLFNTFFSLVGLSVLMSPFRLAIINKLKLQNNDSVPP